ncbi:formyl transferase, partial [Mesorhizobium sp. M7A.F.Ca.CA.001.10.2.1]
MQISLRLDGDCVRAFHLTLLERLAALGDELSVDVRPAGGGIPRSAAALFQLETAIHGLPHDGLAHDGLAKRVPLSALAPYRQSPASPDLVIDLCGDVRLESTRVWHVTYDGASGEAALLASILAGRTPLARIEENGVAIAAGRLGTEYGGIALASFQDMLARTASLIVAA